MAIHHCERCGITFEREGIKRKYRYCGHKCANGGFRKKLDIDQLRALANEGRKGMDIAKELGVSRGTLLDAMRRLGLHGVWARHRFRKCQQVPA